MMVKNLGRGLALVLAACMLAAVVAGCGSSGGGAAATESAEPATEAEAPAAETEAESEPAAESEASGEGGAEILAGFSTPSGSTLQGTKEGPSVVHQDYTTSTAPPEVVSSYKEQLTSAGWSIEREDQGPEYGISATLEGNYFDVEADTEDGSTHFELCAGPGTEAECEALSSDESGSSSGGGSGDDDG